MKTLALVAGAFVPIVAIAFSFTGIRRNSLAIVSMTRWFRSFKLHWRVGRFLEVETCVVAARKIHFQIWKPI